MLSLYYYVSICFWICSESFLNRLRDFAASHLNLDLEVGDLLLPSPRLESQPPQTPSGALSELGLIRLTGPLRGQAPHTAKQRQEVGLLYPPQVPLSRLQFHLWLMDNFFFNINFGCLL